MDQTPLNTDEPVKKPDPALVKEEEELWAKLMEDFDNDELHKGYVGFCLRNGLITSASRRYAAYSESQETYSLERRRKARYWSQQLAGILFAKPSSSEPGSHREGIFGTLTYPEQLGIFFAVLLFLTGVFSGGWWLLLSLGAGGFLGYIFFVKINAVRGKIKKNV